MPGGGRGHGRLRWHHARRRDQGAVPGRVGRGGHAPSHPVPADHVAAGAAAREARRRRPRGLAPGQQHPAAHPAGPAATADGDLLGRRPGRGGWARADGGVSSCGGSLARSLAAPCPFASVAHTQLVEKTFKLLKAIVDIGDDARLSHEAKIERYRGTAEELELVRTRGRRCVSLFGPLGLDLGPATTVASAAVDQLTYSFLHKIARRRQGPLTKLLTWAFDSWRQSDHYCPLDDALAQVRGEPDGCHGGQRRRASRSAATATAAVALAANGRRAARCVGRSRRGRAGVHSGPAPRPRARIAGDGPPGRAVGRVLPPPPAAARRCRRRIVTASCWRVVYSSCTDVVSFMRIASNATCPWADGPAAARRRTCGSRGRSRRRSSAAPRCRGRGRPCTSGRRPPNPPKRRTQGQRARLRSAGSDHRRSQTLSSTHCQAYVRALAKMAGSSSQQAAWPKRWQVMHCNSRSSGVSGFSHAKHTRRSRAPLGATRLDGAESDCVPTHKEPTRALGRLGNREYNRGAPQLLLP